MRSLILGMLFTAAAICLCADPTITPIPSTAISGAPGSTIGWGVTLAVPSSENDYIVLTGSSFSFTGPSYGTYTDYLSTEFLATGAGSSVSSNFDTTAMTGLGQFAINSTAPPNTVISGDLSISYDGYTDSSLSNQIIFDQTARVPVTVNIAAVPEPSSLSLLALALFVFGVTWRSLRPKVTAG
jgi:hypothetical protein